MPGLAVSTFTSRLIDLKYDNLTSKYIERGGGGLPVRGREREREREREGQDKIR